MVGRQEMPPLNFDGLLDVLTKCAEFVIRGIQNNVVSKRKPDGGPQKQNAPSTIAAKGHAHPIMEERMRFGQRGTYVVTPIDDSSVRITVKNPVDSEIAARLQDKGYDFFGITDDAERRCMQLMDAFIDELPRRQWRLK